LHGEISPEEKRKNTSSLDAPVCNGSKAMQKFSPPSLDVLLGGG
jgi:hypothetical protein